MTAEHMEQDVVNKRPSHPASQNVRTEWLENFFLMNPCIPWNTLSENDKDKCLSYLVKLLDANILNGVEFVDALIDFRVDGVHFQTLDVALGISSSA